jgi:putative membrane protein
MWLGPRLCERRGRSLDHLQLRLCPSNLLSEVVYPRKAKVNEATSSEPTARSPEPRSQSSIDVRQQLAADQTLLAWIRTAIALAALGFVVARFNLFLREVQHVSTASWGAARALGLALVALAALVLIIGVFQHRQVSTLLARDGDPVSASKWPAAAGAGVALLAIVAVGIYLATGVK